MNLALARLAFARSLPLAVVVLGAAVLAIAALADWRPPSEWNVAELARADAHAREGVWIAGLVVLGPWLVYASAATVSRWREGDVDWLAQAPLSRWNIVFSTWLGYATACACVVAVTALAAECAARERQPSWRVIGQADAPRGALVGAIDRLSWSVDAPSGLPEGARMRVGVTVFGGAPAASLSLSATRRASDGATTRTRIERRVTASSALDVDVPRGDGTLEVELAREGAGAIVALDGTGVAWLAPLDSSAWISFDIAAAAWLALATLSALALGFGAWLSSAIAATLVATLALATWLFDLPQLAAWLPWTPLSRAIELAGQGLGCAAVGPRELIAGLACVAAAIALARVDLATWRRST